MSNASKKELLAAIKIRYKNSSKEEKQNILDEFCNNCSYHRKHAIRVLNSKSHKKKEE